MNVKNIPLLFGSPDDPAVIHPKPFMRLVRRRRKMGRAKLPKMGIITFSYMKEFLLKVRRQAALREYPCWPGSSLVDFKIRGRRIACAAMQSIAAPSAAMLMEQLWAWGFEKLLLVGGVGVLYDEIPRGSLILPTDAIRDEGTSYHYAPATAKVRPSQELLKNLRRSCSKHGVVALEGKTWTTDAIFRETLRKVKRFQREGAVCVEMEASACFAVAQYRKIHLAALFRAGDSVARPKWQPRHTKRDHAKASKDQDKLFEIAVDALISK